MRGKKHIPSDTVRGKVEILAAMGYPQEFIASKLGMAEKTLRKHYRDILDRAIAEADFAVVQRLYKHATDPNSPPDVSVRACIWWTKGRKSLGWKSNYVHGGDAENPIPVTLAPAEEKLCFDGASTEDKEAFIRIKQAARQAAALAEKAASADGKPG